MIALRSELRAASGRATVLAPAGVFDPLHAERQDGEQHGPPDHQIDHEAGRPAHGAASDLLEFDQRAGEILGMQEQHRLVVGADLGLAVAQHARALRPSACRAAA